MTWQQRFRQLEDKEYEDKDYMDPNNVISFIQSLLSEVINEIPDGLMADSIKLGDVTFREYLKDKYGIK